MSTSLSPLRRKGTVAETSNNPLKRGQTMTSKNSQGKNAKNNNL
jgi:hypothetical protein